MNYLIEETRPVSRHLLDLSIEMHSQGTIYMSSERTNPAITFGFGCWERVEGRFIVGVSDSDLEFLPNFKGGSKTHSHFVSADGWGLTGKAATTTNFCYKSGTLIAGNGAQERSDILDSVQTADHQFTEVASHLPPYLAAYIWVRIV